MFLGHETASTERDHAQCMGSVSSTSTHVRKKLAVETIHVLHSKISFRVPNFEEAGPGQGFSFIWAVRGRAAGQGMVFWPRCPEQGIQFYCLCPKQGKNLSLINRVYHHEQSRGISFERNCGAASVGSMTR